MHPLALQAGISLPIVAGAALYAGLHRESGGLRWLVVAILAASFTWIGAATLVETSPSTGPHALGLNGMVLATAVLAPVLFALVVVRTARDQLGRRGAWLALGAPFAFFLVACLTNAWHHAVVRPEAEILPGAHPDAWAGPLYRAFQLAATGLLATGAASAVRAARRATVPTERQCAHLMFAAVLLPLVAQAAWALGWLPPGLPLTPAALAASALLLVAAVGRYRLLAAPPLARRDLIEHLSDGVLLADADGAVIDTNPAAEALLGAPRSELCGSPLEAAMARLPAKGPARVLARRIARMPQSRGRVSAEIESEAGRVVEVNAGFVAAHGSQPASRYVLLRDCTEKRRFERLVRARQKHESVGILAAGVAHEINNPLAFVRSNLEHLRRLQGDRDDETRSDLTEVIEETVAGLDRIAKIVEGLISFSRIPTQGPAALDLHDALDAALRFSALHELGTLAVNLRLAPDLPPVRASRDRLVQVLLNLLLNAKQALAGRSEGRILIETRRGHDAAEVHVRDNGRGVPEADLEKLFDPFFTTRDPDAVAGLGLSSAFDIVRDFGGTMEVQSEVGAGTCFTVRLPLADEGPRPAGPAPPSGGDSAERLGEREKSPPAPGVGPAGEEQVQRERSGSAA